MYEQYIDVIPVQCTLPNNFQLCNAFENGLCFSGCGTCNTKNTERLLQPDKNRLSECSTDTHQAPAEVVVEKIDTAKLREMLKIPDGVTFDLMGGSIHPETVEYIDRLEAFAVSQYNRESAGA